MEYGHFIKKLQLPPGFTAPKRLAYENLVITAINRADLKDDVAGINASIALINQTRGDDWPTTPVTDEYNYVDLVWHELEFRDGSSFAYVVRDDHGGYLGCCYLYPMGRRTPLNQARLHYDVDVSWWVTREAYEHGFYEKLYVALRHWLAERFPFPAVYYSNVQIPPS
jgi:hypothetical protein